MPALPDLTDLLGALPAPPPPVDWAAVERALAFAVPEDYRELADRYPVFTIDGFLTVFRPGTPGGDLLRPDALLDRLRELRADSPADVAFRLWPEDGGLYPWGITTNGEGLYWDMSTPSGCVVVDGRTGRWESGSLTGRFLLDCLTRQRPCPVFPDTFPSPGWTVRWE